MTRARAIAALAPVIAALGAAACVTPAATFSCETSDQCTVGGTCQPNGFCSFTDATCASGQRYGEASGDFANQCVGEEEVPLGDVAHVGTDVEMGFAATGTLTLADATLSTGVAGSAPSLSVELPAETSLFAHSQDGSGPELAILEVGELTVTGTLTVTGDRPLVIIARGTVTVSGAIEASAVGAVAGPNGVGPGVGGPGAHAGTYDDSGGGGGGFGGDGAAGQVCSTALPGTAGAAYGTAELAVLEGGSGGGQGSVLCAANENLPGAGGGAIQIHATQIALDGAIRANGGGGGGGCGGQAGSGGGSGGAIYLQATSVTGTGLVLAQGGGGGAGATYMGTIGGPGQDGQPTIVAAAGGTTSNVMQNGGTGGFGTTPPAPLTALATGNCGAGGGGVGRIVIRTQGAASVQSSPTANLLGL